MGVERFLVEYNKSISNIRSQIHRRNIRIKDERSSVMMFPNREEAGKLLADELSIYNNRKDTVVMGILRGGIVVAEMISRRLNLPLLPLIVRKLAAPGDSELAIGAIGPGNTRVIDRELIKNLEVTSAYLGQEIRAKREELRKRIQSFKGAHLYLNLGIYAKEKDRKNIILVDDGVATGATAEVAVRYLSSKFKDPFGPSSGRGQRSKIILATPVIAKDTYLKLLPQVAKIVTLEISENFRAVGQFYQEFPQISDERVLELIAKGGG